MFVHLFICNRSEESHLDLFTHLYPILRTVIIEGLSIATCGRSSIYVQTFGQLLTPTILSVQTLIPSNKIIYHTVLLNDALRAVRGI